MEKKDDGGQAFPVPAGSFGSGGEEWSPKEGMTLRDYFAAHALVLFALDRESTTVQIAELAYQLADDMLRARKYV